MTNDKFFALIVGSGFSGAILGSILNRHGRSCIMIDRSKHPRFAIGESSTPIADRLLWNLAQAWDLPALAPLAKFGTWQKSYPELRCGIKRGFSYYGHSINSTWNDDVNHSNSLLVEASSTYGNSDTHWYRPDVDQFFANHARSMGVQSLEETTIESATWDPKEHVWRVQLRTPEGPQLIRATWMIDASGNGEATSAWLGHRPDGEWMRTRSGAIFGHWDGVAEFANKRCVLDSDPPGIFHGDDAAQHHVIDEGWIWMLRFLENRTSVGFVHAGMSTNRRPNASQHADDVWKQLLRDYPSVAALLENAVLVDPKNNDQLPSLKYVERLSRCQSQAVGEGWILLPVTYGFVDPLHSTGIAHALSGVSRIAAALLGPENELDARLHAYGHDLRAELEWIDLIVSGSYQGLGSFERFTAYAMFFFASTIEFETTLANEPIDWDDGFLSCKNARLVQSARETWDTFHRARHDSSNECTRHLVEQVRRAIAPWNRVGLLDPINRNRIPHTTPLK